MYVYKLARFLTVLLLVISVTLLAVGCGGGQKAAEKPKEEAKQEKIVVKMVGTLPVEHHLTKALEMYKDIVEKRSNGKVEIQLYPAQQLYNDKDLVNVLPKGAVEMGLANPDLWTGLVPSLAILNLPTFYQDMDHFVAIRHGEPGEIVGKDFEEKANCKVVGWMDYGPIELISKKPIKNLGDFKGLKMRGAGEYTSIWLNALGAATVTLSSGEIYQALQRGTLDGAISGPPSFLQRKWYEVAKNATKSNIQPSFTFVLLVNLDFWNKLSPELQKIFIDAGKEAEEWAKKICEDEGNKSREQLEARGMVFNEISAEELAKWRKIAVPAMEKRFKERVGEEKAQKILNAAEALRKK